MRFRLSDGRDWAAEFEAAHPAAPAAGIRRIQASRLRTQGAGGHPLIALRRRLAQIKRWLAEREARPDATAQHLAAWRGQASAWIGDARRVAGVVQPLELHVRTRDGAWAPVGPGLTVAAVPWALSPDELRNSGQQWFAAAQAAVAHIARLGELSAFVAGGMVPSLRPVS